MPKSHGALVRLSDSCSPSNVSPLPPCFFPWPTHHTRETTPCNHNATKKKPNSRHLFCAYLDNPSYVRVMAAIFSQDFRDPSNDDCSFSFVLSPVCTFHALLPPCLNCMPLWFIFSWSDECCSSLNNTKLVTISKSCSSNSHTPCFTTRPLRTKAAQPNPRIDLCPSGFHPNPIVLLEHG